MLLGAQVDFSLIGQYWLGGIAVVAVLTLIVRPATVFLCAVPDRRACWKFSARCCSCAGPARPASFRRHWPAYCSGMKAPGAPLIVFVTFIAILMTILIQAPTTEWLGRKLGLLETD